MTEGNIGGRKWQAAEKAWLYGGAGTRPEIGLRRLAEQIQ